MTPIASDPANPLNSFGHRPKPPWLKGLQAAVVVLAIVALVSVIVEHGFYRPPLPVSVLVGVQFAAVVVYLVHLFARVATAQTLWGGIKERSPELLLVFAVFAALAIEWQTTRQPLLKLGSLYVGTLQVVIGLRIGWTAIRWNLELAEKRLAPTRLLVSSFLIVIIAGALLLALPKSRTDAAREAFPGAGETMLNCAFTSVSATCVTGLIVYDTPHHFTRMGQWIILSEIQLGGLGIMIFGSVFGLLIGKQLSVRHSLALQDALAYQTLGQIKRLVWFVLLSTFLLEALGALIIYPIFDLPGLTFGDRVFHAAFHSISAFCNAGFALHTDSLISVRNHLGVFCGFVPLIILGGFGFPVLQDLWEAGRVALKRVWHKRPGAGVASRHKALAMRVRLSLHTKLVLITSGILLTLPTLLLFATESRDWRVPVFGGAVPAPRPDAMVDMPVGERMLGAFFQTVTARTAGFNSVALDENAMSPAGHFVLIILMFIGGSPASTAGGVKTITLAVLFVGVLSTLRGRPRPEVFRRTLSDTLLRRAAVVALLMICTVSATTLALSYTEGTNLREVMFESVSACGTVGLSTGLTGELTVAGRIIIMLAMFAGRLGPLTVMLALAGDKIGGNYSYPTEQVVIA